MRKPSLDTDQVILYRGGSVVSSLANAFGTSLKETRLTALLGYIVALVPDKFAPLFGFKGKVISVSLETRHGSDRSDILVTTTKGIGVVEAKVSSTDPLKQSFRYSANWHTLLTPYSPGPSQKIRKNIKYITWKNLTEPLTELTKSLQPDIRFIATDLLKYMEEHRMIRTQEPVEIYAREINNEETLSLFLHGHLYGSVYKKNSRLIESLYFAPHFGQRIAKNHSGIHVGISYIARIETVETVETWKDFQEVIIAVRGRHWLNRHKDLLNSIHKLRDWDWKSGQMRSFLFFIFATLSF